MKNIREIEGLVKLKDLDDSFIIDLRYARDNNFFGKAMYPVAVCAIKRETGVKLIEAHEIFKKAGYTLKVWDAYRPLHVQRALYEIFPHNTFVAKPPEIPITSGFRPRHNNGMCVDVTLIDSQGREVEMPSKFDDFTEKASPTSETMTEEARKNINYLIEVMESLGFQNHGKEWWHFCDIIETPTPYLDVPLEDFID